MHPRESAFVVKKKKKEKAKSADEKYITAHEEHDGNFILYKLHQILNLLDMCCLIKTF
jgi:hypothetical protein